MPNEANTHREPTVKEGISASPIHNLAAAKAWETEDFLAAEPYPVPEVTEEMVKDFLANKQDTAAKQGFSPGGAPGEHPSAESTAGFAYPPPFNQHEVTNPYTNYPFAAIGKLFFNQLEIKSNTVKSYVASAASIGNNAIWTAGHCVHNGNGLANGWSTNLVFVPGYKDGAAPYGKFTMHQLFCRTNWLQHGNPGGFFEDMGAAILNPLNGRTLSQTVGWLGFAWNFNRAQTWTSLGYPAEAPFNGQRMFQDTATYSNDGSVPGSPAPEGIGCSMTGGCSGGPWVLGLGSTNYINAHNSYRPNNQPLEIYSPYFGDNAHQLKVQVVGS